MKINMKFKKVSVVGLGYIGLPTAAIIASKGIDVVGVDINQHVVNTINAGDIHIIEPGLDVLVRKAVSEGALRATTKVEEADVYIVAVPTPFNVNHSPDLKYIEAVAEAIGPKLEIGNLVLLESTSPVGATEKMAEWLKQHRPELSFPQHAGDDADIHVAHCPERVLPGRVLQEIVSNDRVIGGMSEACSALAVSLYEIFVKGECIVTDSRTAEMTKLTENSFRDVNIAFANELSVICDKLRINVWELIGLANRHPRVNILKPGPGVGGHCIAVDPWFIVDSAPKYSKLLRQAREVNDAKPKYVLEKIMHAINTEQHPVLACFGLTFKADIDDMRQSPALQIVSELGAQDGLDVLVVEPNIDFLPRDLSDKGISLVSMQEALREANIIVILVAHKEFKAINWALLPSKVVVDTLGWTG